MRFFTIFTLCAWIGFGIPASHAQVKAESALTIDLSLLLKKPNLTEMELEPLFFRIVDNPRALLEETEALWLAHPTEENPLFKARLGWLIGRGTFDDAVPDTQVDVPAILSETLDIVEKNKLPLSRAELLYFKIYWDVSKNKIPFEQVMEKLLELAPKVEPAFAKAFLFSRLAIDFIYRRLRANEVPALLTEIKKISDFHGSPIMSTNLVTAYNVAITLGMMYDSKEEPFFSALLDEQCRSRGMRAFCALREYTIGQKEVSLGRPVVGTNHYLKSLQLATEVRDETLMLNSYYGLLSSYSKQKNFKKAIEYGKMAFDGYEKKGSALWASSTLLGISQAYLADGNFKEALKTAQKTLAMGSPEYKLEQVAIHLHLAKVYEKLGNFDKAYEHLVVFKELEKATRTDDLNRQYLQLGLKLEEERNAKLREHVSAEEEKNRLLQKQNELQARELLLTHILRIVAITLLVLLILSAFAMTLAIRRGRQVAQAKQKIQSILDNIEEGLITIDEQLRVKREHSAYAQRLFPKMTLAESEIFSIFSQDFEFALEDLSLWRESLKACLGEDSIAWELNSEHLPREFTNHVLPKKVLSLHWHPIVIEGIIRSFILSIRDITALKALEAEVVSEQQHRQGLQSHIMEILSHNVQESRRLVFDLSRVLPEMERRFGDDHGRKELLRELHTSKGVARSLGLQGLSRSIHALEDGLKGDFRRHQTQSAIEQLRTELASYMFIFEKVLHTSQDADAARNIFDTVHALLPEIQLRLQKASQSLSAVDVVDGVVRWSSKLLQDTRDILIHSLTNAVDHGFIRPLASGVSLRIPHFKIFAERQRHGIALRIQDNGAGIDWPGIEALAKSRGFVPAPDQSWADVLLMDGVSTAEQVSETSGRGVGLAAIQAICQQHQGRVKISDNPEGIGTLLEITLNVDPTPDPNTRG